MWSQMSPPNELKHVFLKRENILAHVKRVLQTRGL